MPLVIASSIELLDVPDGTPILVDAEIGNVYIDPDDEVLSKFSSQQRVRHSLAEQKAQIKPETLTADGTQVRLMANINLLTDLKLAAELKIGMMVELPSVAELMDDFAREADFFSIGTNDLVQFMLGVDRTNESVAELYLPHHPSVLRTLDRIVRSATERGRDVSVCGDMAHVATSRSCWASVSAPSAWTPPTCCAPSRPSVARLSRMPGGWPERRWRRAGSATSPPCSKPRRRRSRRRRRINTAFRKSCRCAPPRPDRRSGSAPTRAIWSSSSSLSSRTPSRPPTARANTASISILRQAGQVEWKFADDCAGIPPEHLEKVFLPFFTTKPPGTGTGLGLFIVKSDR